MSLPARAAVEDCVGLPRVHHRSTTSTNDRARELAQAGAPHGTLVTAGEQTAGRGRQGRVWIAPAGRALLMSLVLRQPGPLVTLAAGVAVAEAVGRDAAIKWPNDVLLADGRKVAGILVESRPQEEWAVLGIGLNVAVRAEHLPAELRARAGSLERPAAEVETVLADVLAGLARWLTAPEAAILEAWSDRDALRGREVAWPAGRGLAEGIDAQGRLLVRDADGRTVGIEAGEVHLARGGPRPQTGLTFESQRTLPGGSVEIVHGVDRTTGVG
ncbi:MAG TPA: biotin--[acetyl-CoA-carboxylase] ligase [Solirubrobacteraceae bacterium]|nr:biotin--[acetyl-CoA-carboxylase] ligase [Solirubrobacteraceae bacterium]